MGIKQIITDDLTGEELRVEVKPTEVRVDGEDYSLYLSDESKETFLALLKGEAPLLKRSVPTAAPRNITPRKAAASNSADKEKLQEIRAWAQSTNYKYKNAKGEEVSLGDRGRIPEVVVKAYEEANA